jgi:hypothetical protein
MARLTIQNLIVSTGKAPGDFVVSVTPLLSWINRKLKPQVQVRDLNGRWKDNQKVNS